MASEDFNYPPDTTSGTELSNKLEKAFEIVSKAYPSTDGNRPDVINDHGRGFWTNVSVSPNVYYYYDGDNDWEVMKLDKGAQYAVYRGKYEIQDDDGSGNHWSIDENSSGNLVIDHPSLPGDGYILKQNGLIESDDSSPATPSNDDELVNKKYADTRGFASGEWHDTKKTLLHKSGNNSSNSDETHSYTFSLTATAATISLKSTNDGGDAERIELWTRQKGHSNWKKRFAGLVIGGPNNQCELLVKVPSGGDLVGGRDWDVYVYETLHI